MQKPWIQWFASKSSGLPPWAWKLSLPLLKVRWKNSLIGIRPKSRRTAARPGSRRRWHLSLSAASVAALLAAAPVAAERTDVVVLASGDRITGEVKKLERGKLEYKTDEMGTVYIEWDSVLEITSNADFQIELSTGELHFGALAPATEKGALQVIGEEETVTAERASVVRIAPIKETFWGRVDGSMDIGLSFIQANDETQLSLGLEGNYRSRRRLETVILDSIHTSQKGVEDTKRDTLQLRSVVFLKKKRALWGLAQLQRNSELELDRRGLVGGGVGYYFIQTNRTLLGLGGGLAVSDEEFSDGGADRSGTEAVLAFDYSIFTYDYPSTEVSLALVIFPSLTESGRVRMEFDGSLRREVVKDFYLNLTLFDSFDSEIPVEGAEKNDWGVITSIGWAF